MSDHIAALEAALENANRHFAHVTVWKNELRDGLDEVKRLREELAAAEARADMHADLGRRTAEALGLTDEEGRAHMPEVAGRLRAENEALKRPLTDEQMFAAMKSVYALGTAPWGWREIGRAIEAAHIEAAQAAKEKT